MTMTPPRLPRLSRRTVLRGAALAAATPLFPLASASASPAVQSFSPTVTTLDLDGLDKGTRLALISLQGLVARRRPEIYLYQSWDSVRNNRGFFDWYTQQGWVTEERHLDDPYQLIGEYSGAARGLVLMDPDQDFTVNIATNIAGVEQLVIAYPDMASQIDLPVVRDLRGQFTDPLSAYQWAYREYWPRQSRDALCCFYYSTPHDFQRDYAVQNRLHTFWLPGPDDPEYSDAFEQHVRGLLQAAPPNIPVFGFWAEPTDAGQERGPGEYPGVKLAGNYAKYTWVSDWAGNYSFHAAAPVDTTAFASQPARRKTVRRYDPSKKYVALIMIESGDSPGYLQYGLRFFQWDDPVRGQVPLSYGITPGARTLLPGVLQWLYQTATPNDYLFSSISGLGYCYPLEGYGDSGASLPDGRIAGRDEVMADYFRLTGASMAALDMDMLGLYSHPFTPWTPADDTTIDQYVVANMPRVRSVIADMGRNDGTTASNANTWAGNEVSVHHTLTRWPATSWYPPYDPANDEPAAQWLAGEIRANATGGEFIQAMFYSWYYGPRRLRRVADLLEPEGFVFVTLDEFDHLWRASQENTQRQR